MDNFKKNYKKVLSSLLFCADGNGWVKLNRAGVAVVLTILACGFLFGYLTGVSV